MPKQKSPSIEEMGAIMEKRSSHLSSKLDDLTSQINALKNQYRTASTFEKESLRRRLEQLIRQRKNLENHLQNHLNSQNAVENALFSVQMTKETFDSVVSMQQAAKTMKKSLKKIPERKVEKMLNFLEEYNFRASEINDILGCNYEVDYNMDDIDAELGELDAELAMEMDEPGKNPLYFGERKSSNDELAALM